MQTLADVVVNIEIIGDLAGPGFYLKRERDKLLRGVTARGQAQSERLKRNCSAIEITNAVLYIEDHYER